MLACRSGRRGGVQLVCTALTIAATICFLHGTAAAPGGTAAATTTTGGAPAAAAATTRNASRSGLDPLELPDCSDVPVSVGQLELAANADLVVTGITLAAGPGAGLCDPETGELNVALDNSTDPSTNFIVIGVQCVHKGLLSCRANAEDTKDCLILVVAPAMKDAAPCSLAQGERYQLYLQSPNRTQGGCAGYHLTMYEKIWHSVRRPVGGTGCTFYPSFPQPTEFQKQVAASCDKPVACASDPCDPLVTKSPCANDTSVSCFSKSCGGKWMWHNAILPEDTCYEVYQYTSGVPTNCYGRRYVNNRIRQLASEGMREAANNSTLLAELAAEQQAGNATGNGTAPASSTPLAGGAGGAGVGGMTTSAALNRTAAAAAADEVDGGSFKVGGGGGAAQQAAGTGGADAGRLSKLVQALRNNGGN